MANYLKLFEDETAYNEFKGSSAYVTPNVSVCSGGGSIFYNPYVHDYSKDYFTTVAKEDGTISFSGSNTANTLSYSTDNGTTWSTPIQEPSVTVNAGDKVLWKGICTPTYYGIGQFRNGTATFDVEGNVMSLIYGDDFKGQTSLVGKDFAFLNLFSGNTKVISAENLSLPATTLTQYCYGSMFNNCTSLTSAPALPAMTLAEGCYQYMFQECTSLTTAPSVLPATTLAEYCYYNMFYNCSSLVNAPSSIGDSSTVMEISACAYMFSGCTSLASAPALPAMTLAQECYSYMFQECSSLTIAPSLPATELAESCYSYMFSDCSSLTTAPSLPAITLATGCYYYMFGFCPGLTSAPELPAMILADDCYSQMFDGCSSLNSITCLATDITASNCTTNWVNGVASSGTFTKAASMTKWTTGDSGIPTGWTVQTA